jgi:TorA maturation chaperone TorD
MTETETAQLGEEMLSRLQVYTLLVRLYRKEVDEELLTAMQQNGILSQDTEGLPAGIRDGLKQMQDYLASEEASVLNLARDYAKVFCGASSTNKTAAYPFESVYTSPDGMLMQEARDEALAWYRRYGLGKSDEWFDCEDHVAVEMDFLIYLINEYLDAAENDRPAQANELLLAQRQFMQEHLVNWVPEFASRTTRAARTGFYRGLASLLAAYLEQDYAALAEVADETADKATGAATDEATDEAANKAAAGVAA